MCLKLTFYLFFALFIQIANSKKLPAICNACDCNFNLENTKFDIKCEKIWPDVSLIFKEENWETSYPEFSVNEFSIKKTNLSYLSQVFPRSNLETLNLAHNSISKIGGDIFRNLPNMKTFILSHNNISTVYSIKFCNELGSLKSLYLDHNNISLLYMQSFMYCSNMEYLSLSHNPLGDINGETLKTIESLVRLRELDLSFTHIKKLPEAMIISLYFLKHLDISSNDFETIPRALNFALDLTTLNLSDNPITNLTQENVFPRMKSLKSLRMRSMPSMRLIGARALSQLDNLEELDLSGSNLVELSKNALLFRDAKYETWPPIKKLYINHTKLAYLDRHVIGLWDELVELDMSGILWRCDCQNQWLLDELYPIYLRVNEAKALQMKCALNTTLFRFSEMKEKNESMYCPNERQWTLGSILSVVFIVAGLVILVLCCCCCARVAMVMVLLNVFCCLGRKLQQQQQSF